MTPFPSIKWIHQGHDEESQERLQENGQIPPCSGQSITPAMLHTHHGRPPVPSRDSTWSSSSRNSSFKTIQKGQYTSDQAKTSRTPKKNKKEHFDRAYRSKDLRTLKIKEQVQFFHNKQGTGPIKWTTGTVTKILECG